MKARSFLTAMVFTAVAVGGAAAQTAAPTPIKKNGEWSSFSHGTGTGKVCFALTKPTTLRPPNLNHGDVFFFVSNRPSEGVRNEPSLLVGYTLQEGSKVIVDIDGQKFTLYTKGEGAWVENASEEGSLVDAMRKGRAMAVTATSGRGNATSYAFSLSGITASISDIDAACK